MSEQLPASGLTDPEIPTFLPPPPLSFTTPDPDPFSTPVSLPGSILSLSTEAPTDTSVSQPTPTDSQLSGTETGPSMSTSSTDSQTVSYPTSSQSSSSSSAASPTFIAATSSSHKNVGAIAGGVIGGVALLVLLICGLLFFLKRRNRSKEVLPWGGGGRRGNVRISSSSGLAVNAGGFGAGAAGRWIRDSGDLTSHSFDHPDRHASAVSAATLADPRRANSMSSNTHIGSHEGYMTEDDEKVPGTPSTLQGHGAFGKQSLDDIPALPMEPPSAYAYGLGRQRSLTSQNRAAALAKLDSTNVTISRSNSAGARDSQNTASTPATPTRDNRANRASGGASANKRTPRKAVPKYDEAEFAMSDFPSPTEPSRAISPPPSTYPPALNRSNSATGRNSGSRHGSRSGSSANLHSQYLGAELPALNHKTSFGDAQPIHYLIPDLPPPQKD